MNDALLIPELGQLLLALAIPTAIAMSALPLYGAQRNISLFMRSAAALAVIQWLLLVAAFAVLAYAFLHDDFSVKLVAAHSNTALPAYYKFSAVWGNHEGSLLLWVLILASWTLAVAVGSRSLPLAIKARVIAVLGLISLGFLLFIAFTSNPFERQLLSTVLEGNDLNPLLQDIGLILHPPLLYVGYVGFSVAFAFAIAALLAGQYDAQWARWTRPWTNTAWAFLTIGIALGSWWAYYELGWGGWWFWDPVENASFMPWLAGTALVHSLSATEKRGVFRSWTLLLAILAFSLSLLGTFLVRSGILVSVHAFASDPARGIYILWFLSLVVGGSLLLYALRAPSMPSAARYSLRSREAGILANNLVLSTSLATVLIGTLFPLLAAALEMGSYSVGPPYFNALFLPLMVLLVVLMGFAPSTQWQDTAPAKLLGVQQLRLAAIAALAGLLLAWWSGAYFEQGFMPLAWLTLAIASWLLLATLADVQRKRKLRNGALGASYWGMVIAHSGIAITAVGIGLTSLYTEQRDLRMQVGDSAQLLRYQFVFEKLEPVMGPNYRSDFATVGVYSGNSDNAALATLHPEKRLYNASRNIMTEAGIDAGITRDLYVALGERFDDGSWAVRLHVKPFVRWIWFGAAMMALGGLLAVLDKRYRTAGRSAA